MRAAIIFGATYWAVMCLVMMVRLWRTGGQKPWAVRLGEMRPGRAHRGG